MSDTDLNKRVDDLTVILEINRQLGGAATDLNRLLALIVAGACRIFEAERGTIFLYDELNNVLVSKVATGQEELRVPADKGIVGAAAQSGETVNVPDAYADPRFNSKVDEETGFRTRNLLTLPLKDHEDKLVGVLQILNKRGGAFDADDEQVAAALSAQAGVALQRAMLIQEYLEKKRIERRLTTIREREAAKSRVMRVAAHQLRSPLAAAISLLRSMDAAYQKGPRPSPTCPPGPRPDAIRCWNSSTTCFASWRFAKYRIGPPPSPPTPTKPSAEPSSDFGNWPPKSSSS